jgi:hypothetical protein
MIKNILGWLLKYEALVFIICLVILLRIPSLFEPYWYGDEGIYLTIGKAIRAGVPLYTGIHDNKPPLLYFAAALSGGNQFWFKFIATIWVVAEIPVFWCLAKKMFSKEKYVYLSTAIFAFLICWPKLEGNIANAEIFFLLPTLIAFNMLWRDVLNFRKIFWAGFLFGIGGLFKMPAIIEAGVWPIWWLSGKDKNWFKKSLVLGVGVMMPIILSVGYYAVQGGAREYLTAAWAQNLPYLSSWKATSSEKGIYSVKGRALVTLGLILAVWLVSKKEDKKIRILGWWFVITLFSSLLSGRPYPHYLLQIIGSLALWLILLLAGTKKEKGLGLIFAALLVATTQVFNFYGYRVVSYYDNFINFALNKKTKAEYFSWFDAKVNDNYEIAGKITAGSQPEDRIFVWGDEPMIYAISGLLPTGKYTVKYHIKDFRAEETTMKALKLNLPKYIVSFGNEDELPGLELLLKQDYLIQGTVGKALVYRRIMGGI